MKRNTMAQWMNLYWNSSFINRMQLPLLCKAILLLLVGLTAVWQAVRSKLFKNSQWIALVGFSRRLAKVQCYYSVTNAFQLIFSGKVRIL